MRESDTWRPALEELPRLPGPLPGAATTVRRHLSLWPFGTRSVTLHLVLHASVEDERLIAAALRAMQHEYFRSEARSQTNALRCAIHAAHYVLRNRNRGQLSHGRVTAAAGCAATRGSTTYVALAGEASAFAWDGTTLRAHGGASRAARPLGGESAPRVAFWSAPASPGSRLVLACGAAWKDDTLEGTQSVMGAHDDRAAADLLSVTLAGPDGPARTLVATIAPAAPNADPVHPARVAAAAHPRAKPPTLTRRGPVATRARGAPRRLASGRFPITAAAVIVLLVSVLAGGLWLRGRLSEPIAASSGTTAATESAAATANVQTRVVPENMASLGAAAGGVSDLLAGPDALYTLNVQDGDIRRYPYAGQPASMGAVAAGRNARPPAPSGQPVAMVWLTNDGPAGSGTIAVLGRDRRLTPLTAQGSAPRALPGSERWQRVDALAANSGALYVLDTGQRRLLAYPGSGGAARAVLDQNSTPAIPVAEVTDVVAQADLHLRLQDGTVRRIDDRGFTLPFQVGTLDPPLGAVASIAADRAGGLYLADPVNHRLVQVAADGQVRRQLGWSEGGYGADLRLIETSPDGTTLYSLDGSDLWRLPLPARPSTSARL